MYEPLSIDQLRECIKNKTKCFIFQEDKVYEVYIKFLEIGYDYDKVEVMSDSFKGYMKAALVGLSANHAKVLYLTNKLDKLNIKIDQLDEERRHIFCELVKIKENVVHKEEDCD